MKIKGKESFDLIINGETHKAIRGEGGVYTKWKENNNKTEWEISCNKPFWDKNKQDLPKWIKNKHPNFSNIKTSNPKINGEYSCDSKIYGLFVNRKQTMANGDIIDEQRVFEEFYGNVGMYNLENRYHCTGLLLLNNSYKNSN